MTGTAVPPCSMPSTSTSGLPTMKSTCTAEWLTPAASRSSHDHVAAAGERLREALAVRDVRRGVLVEERVVEGDPGPADA